MSVVVVPRPRGREESPPAASPRSQEPADARLSARVGPLLYLFPGYLLLLAAAELLSRQAGLVMPALGPLLYGIALVLLLLHAALCWDQPFRCLPLTLSLAPAARLLLFSPTVGRVAGLEYYLALGLPVMTVAVAAASLGLPLRDVLCPARAGAALCRRAWPLLVRIVAVRVAGWARGLRLQRLAGLLRAPGVWQGLAWRGPFLPMAARLSDWLRFQCGAARARLVWGRALPSVGALALRLAVHLGDGGRRLGSGLSTSACWLGQRARSLAAQALSRTPLGTRMSAAGTRMGTVAPPVAVPWLGLACAGALVLLAALQAGIPALSGGPVQGAGGDAVSAVSRPLKQRVVALLGQERLTAAPVEGALPIPPAAGPAGEAPAGEERALVRRAVDLPVEQLLSQEQRPPAGRPDTRAASVEEVFPPAPVPAAAPRSAAAPAAPAAVFPDGCPGGGYENQYPWGVCTWYAKARRPDLPWFLGEYGMAYYWGYAARTCGFVVDTEPAAGAVIVFSPGANGASPGGHVGYVEEAGPDYVLISECNVGHDSYYVEEPRWWEAGYPCAYRRIPRAGLDPGIEYIHGPAEPGP